LEIDAGVAAFLFARERLEGEEELDVERDGLELRLAGLAFGEE